MLFFKVLYTLGFWILFSDLKAIYEEQGMED